MFNRKEEIHYICHILNNILLYLSFFIISYTLHSNHIHACIYKYIPSLKLTNHLKVDGWNTSFLLGWPISISNMPYSYNRSGTLLQQSQLFRPRKHTSNFSNKNFNWRGPMEKNVFKMKGTKKSIGILINQILLDV